jgi:predicted phosphodiesterase
MCMSKKIALISDIHGNSSALKAVLKKIEEDIGIEHIYWLGDLIGIGYETNEVLELFLLVRIFLLY